MNKRRYETTVRFFSTNKTAHALLSFIYKFLPNLLFLSYPALIIIEFFVMGFGWQWLRMVVVPAGVLGFVSAMRVIINEERPYERYKIPSVFHKTTVGQSMPSRHTASAYIIAMTFLSVNPVTGVITLFIASLIEASRVMAGAHFIRDVVVGAAIGISAGIVFYFVL